MDRHVLSCFVLVRMTQTLWLGCGITQLRACGTARSIQNPPMAVMSRDLVVEGSGFRGMAWPQKVLSWLLYPLVLQIG